MCYSTKLKTYFCIYMSPTCVQISTAFDLLCYGYMCLGECHKIPDCRHFHRNETWGKMILFFLSIFFNTDHNKYTVKWVG